MRRGILTYTLYFISIDSIANLIINLIQGNPIIVIVLSTMLRIFFLLFLIPIIGSIIINFLFKSKMIFISLIVTHIIIYALIPIAVYLVKENTYSIGRVFIDLHTKFNLFSLIFFPYIIASIILIYISSKSKLV